MKKPKVGSISSGQYGWGGLAYSGLSVRGCPVFRTANPLKMGDDGETKEEKE
jgi:hypothetical protein